MAEGDTYAEDALLANQFDMLVFDTALCVALGVGLEIAEVADVTFAILWSTMLFAEWID